MFWANGHALLAEACAGKAKIWIAGLCFALLAEACMRRESKDMDCWAVFCLRGEQKYIHCLFIGCRLLFIIPFYKCIS